MRWYRVVMEPGMVNHEIRHCRLYLRAKDLATAQSMLTLFSGVTGWRAGRGVEPKKLHPVYAWFVIGGFPFNPPYVWSVLADREGMTYWATEEEMQNHPKAFSGQVLYPAKHLFY